MQNELEFEMKQPAQPFIGVEASSALDAAYISGLCAGLSFRSLLTYDSFGSSEEALAPYVHTKPEPLFTMNSAVCGETTPFNFFAEAARFPPHLFQKLPELLSLEPPSHYTMLADASLPLNHGAETMSVGMRKQKPRRRRSEQKLSEKTRCLQKLLPWNKKMDVATTLEEAYKYIKFLQAQTTVLQSMPSCVTGGGGDAALSEAGGDLGRLNRQQLLQVVVNSPVAQAHLCTKGCCVYSIEQLVLLKKKAERKALVHQVLLDSNPNSAMLS